MITFKENLIFEMVGTTELGQYVFSVENNNDTQLYINNISIVLKDEDGFLGARATCAVSNFCIGANSKIVLYTTEYSANGLYTNYEFQVDISSYSCDYFAIVDNFEISAESIGSGLSITAINNNDSIVTAVQAVVIYYKDSSPVGATYVTDESYVDVYPGEASYMLAEYSYSDYYAIVDFDDYDVYVIYSSIY